MTSKNLLKNTMLAAAGAGIITLAGCSNDDDDKAQLRVIHASPDAPAVNILLDSSTAISNLDYADSSGFQSINAGIRDITVEAIIPGGNANVITVPDFPFAKDSRSTVIAVDNTASIEPFVADESTATPASGEVAVAVVHASPDAPAVDVYVTAPGTDVSDPNVQPNFTFDFKDPAVDAGALPAATYDITVTLSGTKTVAYNISDVDLSPFAGQKLLIAAVSTTSDTTRAASPIKLLVATDDAQVILMDEDTQTGARVVHVSPNADTLGPVEVFATSNALPASPAELIDAFSYTEIVPAADSYVGVPAGDYVFDVALDGAGIGNSVYTSPSLPLAQGAEYSVVAAGYVAADPAFDLLATEDRNRAVATQASVKVIHAAPAAGTVDVYVTAAGVFTAADVENGVAGAPLLDDFAFAEITEYVAVAPGNYDIRVVAGGTTAINVENFNLAAGSVSTVIARGPNDTGTPSDFNVIVLTN